MDGKDPVAEQNPAAELEMRNREKGAAAVSEDIADITKPFGLFKTWKRALGFPRLHHTGPFP